MKLGSSLLCFALLSTCSPEASIKAPVVAPAGDATKAVPGAIAVGQQAEAERFSKVAASAEAIVAINAGQPAGARTDGVTAEAELIKRTAGAPSDADRIAALERARTVAEGKAADIAAAYTTARSAADIAKAKADAAEQALTAALAAAATEQEAQRARLQQEMDRIATEANARVAAAVKAGLDEARAWQRRVVTILTFGLGALLIAGGVVVTMTATSIPMFGPKAGLGLIGAGGALVVLGIIITQVQNFIEDHPWITGIFLGTCGLATAIAVSLMYANHKHRPT
jgi:hypothetical protein